MSCHNQALFSKFLKLSYCNKRNSPLSNNKVGNIFSEERRPLENQECEQKIMFFSSQVNTFVQVLNSENCEVSKATDESESCISKSH